jgi:hypothetical protein
MAKCYYFNPDIILASRKLSFRFISVNIPLLPTFALKSRNNIFVRYLGNLSNTRSISPQKAYIASSLSYSVQACAFKTISTANILFNVYVHRAVTRSIKYRSHQIPQSFTPKQFSALCVFSEIKHPPPRFNHLSPGCSSLHNFIAHSRYIAAAEALGEFYET